MGIRNVIRRGTKDNSSSVGDSALLLLPVVHLHRPLRRSDKSSLTREITAKDEKSSPSSTVELTVGVVKCDADRWDAWTWAKELNNPSTRNAKDLILIVMKRVRLANLILQVGEG